MSATRKWSIGVLCILAGGCWYLLQPRSSFPEVKEITRQVPVATKERQSADTQEVLQSSTAVSLSAINTPPVTTYRSFAGTNEKMPRHEGISRFRSLKGKLLTRQEEREEMRELARNRELLQFAGSVLRYHAAVADSETGTFVRMAHIDFLRAAANDEDNPNRDMVQNVLVSAIEMPLDKGMNREARVARITDKVELFRLLQQYFPEQATLLLNQNHDENMQEILRFAAGQS